MAKKNALFSALAVAALWLAWIAAYYGVKNDYVLPSFWDTLRETGRLLVSASFWRAFFNTFLRTLWAFLISLALGVGMAVAAHLFGWHLRTEDGRVPTADLTAELSEIMAALGETGKN